MAAEGLPIERACPLLGVSVSGYYCWLRRPPSARSVRHAWLSEVVGQIHADSRQTYGSKRVHAELTLGRGIAVCPQTVENLMRRAGLRGASGRPKYRKVPNMATASDLVERDFARSEPDRLWVTDITEHSTREGKVYCAVVLDTFSRRVVGWSIDSRPTAALVTNALGMAIDGRQPAKGETVIHSDQGTQAGFNRSSQHLDDGGVCCGDDEGAPAGGSAVSGAGAIAGAADGCVASGPGGVLGGDRPGRQDRRRVGGGWGVVPGWV
ncbi:MAG: IS3 family transposase [Acidimicrobiia bacterium]|nr:IS3 family transposase [Acidimicrobiia bacterium]